MDFNPSLPETAAGEKRLYDVDWLRVFAILFLILLHTAVLFIPQSSSHGQSGELITENVTLTAQIFSHFVHQWLLPLFFFLSGVGAWYSLRRRGNFKFVTERARRLLIPLALIFLVIPIREYPRALMGGYDGSILQHIPVTYASFTQHDAGWYLSYLWFLPYLFIYSVLILSLADWVRSDSGQARIRGWVQWLAKPGRIFLLVLPLILVEVLFRAQFGTTKDLVNDWASLMAYGIVFLYGFLFLHFEQFRQTIRKVGWLSIALGVVSFITIITLNLQDIPAEIEPHNQLTVGWYVFCVARSFNTLFWIIGLVSLGERYLNFDSPILRYMNEAVLPIYLLHMPINTILGYYLIPANIPPLLNFVLINVLTFIGCIVIYEIIVKPFNLTRFFFGMKLKDNQTEAEQLATAAQTGD